MKMIEKIKSRYKNYITRLEKTNKSEFGEGGLDCCDLNKNGQKKE